MPMVNKRFWRFAAVNFLGIIVVAAAIAALYRYVTVENFKQMRAQQNLELAVVLSNSVASQIDDLQGLAAELSWAELQSTPEIEQIGAIIDRELAHLPVYVVNIFSPEGLVLYSTDRQQIGAKVLLNGGFEIAARGQPTSAMVRRDSFNQYDRVVEDRDMVETYLPLRDSDGRVFGVFEIHSDISEFFSQVDSTQQTIIVGTSAALLLLYILLIATFWDSDRQLFMGLSLPGRHRYSDDESISRAKADFVATISHEVRTPLNAVLGMTDLLNLTSLTRKQREYIQTIQSSGDMLLSLVDNLLDFSDMEAGDVQLHASEFDVVDLLERVLRIMGHSASTKGLELAADIRHDFDLRVSADKRRLRQILVNIIGNAVKFTDAGEIVILSETVAAGDGEFWLHIEVSDTGPGIDDEQREQLFTAFASGARPASDQQYGSGLGLTICKQLLDVMGGRIDIRSRETGGAVVVVDVPVKLESPASTAEFVPAAAESGVRILSLHGNRATAGIFCRMLAKWGMSCEHVFDVGDGVHRLRAAASSGRPFDCVIVDSALTPEDFLLTVKRIRGTEEIANTPVVLLTSISEPLAVGEITALGHVRCINKPVLPLELRYNLKRSLEPEQLPGPKGLENGGIFPERATTRILIAEDNPVSSGVLLSMLRTEGFDADVVDNGPAVLEALKDQRYELLLLDCQMPGMDGDVVTAKIRNAPGHEYGNPVIVAVTADTTEHHRSQCLTAGMDDFVPKPVRLDNLRRGLQRWHVLLAERQAETASVAPTDLRRRIAKRAGQVDESFVSGYIDLFLTDAEHRLLRISVAADSGDTDTVRREGHALKGSCLELGAERMARICDDLSVAAKSDDLDEVGMAASRLSREFARLRPVYKSAQVSSTSPS